MASEPPDEALTPTERRKLSAISGATTLAELRAVVGGDDDHDAYFRGKRAWRTLRAKQLGDPGPVDGIPGTTVAVGDRRFHVHGVTHADTDPERAFLREHVGRALDAGAAVYAEQGIRPMYFADVGGVCEMDDYRWAMARCAELDGEAPVPPGEFDGIGEELDSLTARFREAVFSLIDGGEDAQARRVRSALGDVASSLLTSHETLATGEDFASFALARRAARDPSRLGALQRYYETAFLPQPLEREWLRRHDPEVEIVTHARNERQADYAVYHAEAPEVHLVVGAAHQPGVAYYLRRHRDGDRSAADYQPVR